MKKFLLATIIFISTLSISYSQCTKPALVTITGSTTGISICEGSALTLSGSATVNAASQNGGFTYSWIKGSTVIVSPTTIVINTNTANIIQSYNVGTTVIADAGTYMLRIEDGNAGASICYTEASIVVTINPKPTITSASTGLACSGVAQNYLITSNVASTYTWTRAAVAGIANATGAGTSNAITETLTNTTAMPIVVRYFITATSTASCVSPVFYYDVTVNPKPNINSTATGIICSGVAQNYSITCLTPCNYTWTREVVSGISNATGSGTSNLITEALTNTTTSPVVVRYNITPTSTAGSCIGTPFNYDVTVYPVNFNPSVSISSNKITICSGDAVRFFITTTIPNSSYEWFINNISQGTPSIYNSSLTSSSLTSTDIVYVKMIVNPMCGSSVTEVISNSLSITIHPPITSGTIGSDQIICYNEIPDAIVELTTPTNVSSNLSYFWQGSIDGITWEYIPESLSLHIIESPLIKDLYIRRRVTDQSFIGICNMATSNSVHITVVPCTAFNSTITGDAQITPGQQNAVYSVPNQSGFTYDWAITGGTIISGQNTNAVTVNWDTSISGPQVRTTSTSYSISVTETNHANQSNTTTLDITTLTTAITQSQAQSGIKLFPNPTTESFNIEMRESGIDVAYEILDLTGLSVASGTFTFTGNDQKIATDFGAGMYQVILKYNNIVTCIRLSKVQ